MAQTIRIKGARDPYSLGYKIEKTCGIHEKIGVNDLKNEIDINDVLHRLIWSNLTSISNKWDCFLTSNTSGSKILRNYTSRLATKGQHYTNLDAFPPIQFATSGIEGPYDGPDQNGDPVLAYHLQIRLSRGLSWAFVFRINRDTATHTALKSLLDAFRFDSLLNAIDNIV